MRLPTRKAETDRELLRQDDHFLTPAAIERMKKDLERLVKSERGPAAEEVHRLAQMGDLSENAAYQFAKQHLRRINGRITSIEEKLKHAIPIQAGSVDGKIRIGSTVTVRLNDKNMTFEIVGSQETNPAKGRISHLSPIGQALLGNKTGETATVKTADRVIVYEILIVE
jgi:transcription elongation factor GreA